VKYNPADFEKTLERHAEGNPQTSAQKGTTSIPPAKRFTTIRFLRNQTTASKSFNFGATFQQNIEPAGAYFIEDELGTMHPPMGWVRGTKHFKNPLVIEWNTNPNGGYDATSWKAVLHKMFKVKGKALSKRLLKEGYDAIVTLKKFEGKWVTSEMVDLTVVR
jgi:hypothetical protein